MKRSINIDMTSVRFCTPEMLAKYRKIQLLKDYVEQTEEVIESTMQKTASITPSSSTDAARPIWVCSGRI